MKTSPRNKAHCAFSITLALIVTLSYTPALAQRRARRPAQSAPRAQPQDGERARRAKALTLLFETAEAARTLDDLFYRARLQSLIADAVWPFDKERARTIFRHAWEAAAASDKAEQESEAEETGAAPEATAPVTEARDEVLSKTAARDASLAGIFLRDLLKGKGEAAPERGETARATTWIEPSATGARRLALGFELLAKGQADSAFKIVAPVAGERASANLMAFLLRLREQDPALGERLYRLMITRMSKDASADPNTVLLLSTPIVSPELMVAIDEYGSLQFRPVARANSTASRPQQQAPPALPPATRSSFFTAAVAVLLRPATLRPGGSETQERAARYFAIARLLPFFEREAAEYAPELQARAVALLNEFTESRRAGLSSQLDVRTLSSPTSNDPLRSHFEELARTGTQIERDRITLRIILIAAQNRSWDRARRAAAELSDANVRRAANSYIAVNQISDITNAYADEKEDDYESIVSFLKGVDVPPLAAAWGYAQAARVAARKKERQRTDELLTEAEHYAERVEAGTSQRVAAYGVIIAEAARLDSVRAWELLTKLVKAANGIEDYAGDEVSIEIRIDENAATVAETPFKWTTPVFRLDAIFATMVQLDFERALSNARALEGEVPRVFAQLAIARALLEKKQ